MAAEVAIPLPPASNIIRFSDTRFSNITRFSSTSYASSWSSQTGGSFTNTFAHSSSTVWGPGALTGKRLKAFGEAVIRSAEAMVIRRRLAVIESYFPHEGPSDSVEEMYDDLLELTRVDYYSPKIRQRAMRLIIDQVNIGETECLIKCISKWPSVEIRLFITEFLSFPFSDSCPESINYVLEQGSLLSRFTYRFVIFICKLARINQPTYRLLIRFGLLDMILRICVSPYERWISYTSEDVLAVCNSTLRRMCTDPADLEVLHAHLLVKLWPSYVPFFLQS